MTLQSGDDDAETATVAAESGKSSVVVSGLELHNAVFKDGQLVVVAGQHHLSTVTLQLKQRPTNNEYQLYYPCPVRMRDVVGEITVPCEDTASCHQRSVYLSCSSHLSQS